MSIKYKAHVQNQGWQNEVSDGATAGTVQQHTPMEAFMITDLGVPNLGIHGFAHVSNVGWSTGNVLNEVIGSTGQGHPIEAIRIGLIGTEAGNYDIWYRCHISGAGWLNWSCNGENNGTEGGAIPVEAVQIELHKKSENWYPYVDSQTEYRNFTAERAAAAEAAKAQAASQNKPAQLLALAQSQIGYASGTSQDSAYGRELAGVNAGDWCCYFVWWCCKHSGVNFPATGYCPTVVDWAKKNGRWTGTPKPGYAVLFDFNSNGTADHIGIVESPINGGAVTIEGNTSGNSGTGVYRKVRDFGILGYVNLF